MRRKSSPGVSDPVHGPDPPRCLRFPQGLEVPLVLLGVCLGELRDGAVERPTAKPAVCLCAR